MLFFHYLMRMYVPKHSSLRCNVEYTERLRDNGMESVKNDRGHSVMNKEKNPRLISQGVGIFNCHIWNPCLNIIKGVAFQRKVINSSVLKSLCNALYIAEWLQVLQLHVGY